MESKNVGTHVMESCANCLEPFPLSMTNFDGDGDNLINFEIDRGSSFCQKKMYRDFYIEQIIPNDDGDYDPLNYFSSDPLTTRRNKVLINVKEAVSAMYQLCYLSMFKNMDNEEDGLQENDQYDIRICAKCASLVKTMYSAYDEFNRVRRQNSYFYKQIQKLDKMMCQLQVKFQSIKNHNHHHQIPAQFVIKNDETEFLDDFDDDNNNDSMEQEDRGSAINLDTDESENGTQLQGRSGVKIESEYEGQNNLFSTLSLASRLEGQPWIKLCRLTKSEIEKYKPNSKRSRNKAVRRANDVFDDDDDDDLKKDFKEQDNDDEDYIPEEDEVKPKRRSKSFKTIRSKEPCQKLAPEWREHAIIHEEAKTQQKHGLSKPGKYECKICGKIYTSESGIKLDVYGHRGQRPYKCQYENCTKSFMARNALTLHTMIHTGEPRPKRFRIRIRPKTDPVVRPIPVWREHTIIHEEAKTPQKHGETKAGKYECKICAKIYTSEAGIKLHVHGHRGDRPFPCDHDECTKSFMSKGALTLHKMVHAGEKFPCTICSKLFSSPTSLAEHVQVLHDQIKPFLCNECGRKYSNATHLRNHQRIHSDLRPFKCPSCGRGFKQMGGLAKHRMIHEGRRFLCPVCGMSFSRDDNLKKHVQKHHLQPKRTVEDDQ